MWAYRRVQELLERLFVVDTRRRRQTILAPMISTARAIVNGNVVGVKKKKVLCFGNSLHHNISFGAEYYGIFADMERIFDVVEGRQ